MKYQPPFSFINIGQRSRNGNIASSVWSSRTKEKTVHCNWKRKTIQCPVLRSVFILNLSSTEMKKCILCTSE